MTFKPIAILRSRYHPTVSEGLYLGALRALSEEGWGKDSVETFEAPGAFEMPVLASELGRTGRYSGVVCLGCVIKGDTAHFEFISAGAALGIQTAAIESRTPIAFGVLTTYTEDQALFRARDDGENKGREAARACARAVKELARIRG